MKSRTVIVTLLVLVCGSSLALAQGRGDRGGRRGPGGRGGGRGGISEMALLNVEAVRKELGLLDDQIASIKEAAKELRGQGRRGERPDVENMTDDERHEWFTSRRKQAKESATKAQETLKSILLDDQLARLHEIYLQVAGGQAVSNTKVASELGLSDDQKAQIVEVRQGAMRRMREEMREVSRSDDRSEMRKKMAKLRKSTDKKVLAVLNSDQQQQFESMKGEPFEMPEGAMFGGRRGRGGPDARSARGRQGDRQGRRQRNRNGQRSRRGDRPDRAQRPE